MLKKLKRHSHLLYKTGMFLSFLCLIHCLATPILLTALPFIAKDFISHTTEIYLILGSIGIGIYLLSRDYQVHKNKTPLLLLVLASSSHFLGLMIVAEHLELPFIILGSLLLSGSYILNWRLHSKICTEHHH
jgi:hypothetical protein